MTTPKKPEAVEDRHFFCRVCGYSPRSHGDWCDKGCGRDYNTMLEIPPFVASHLLRLYEDNGRYLRTLEYLLYQSGHKDGNIGEYEMKLIQKVLPPTLSHD